MYFLLPLFIPPISLFQPVENSMVAILTIRQALNSAGKQLVYPVWQGNQAWHGDHQ